MQLAANRNVIFPGKCKMMIMSHIVLNIRVWDRSLIMGREGRRYKTGGVGVSQVLPLQRERWGGGEEKRFTPC